MNILERFKSMWQSNRVKVLQKLVELQAIELEDYREQLKERDEELKRVLQTHRDARELLGCDIEVRNKTIEEMYASAQVILTLGKSFVRRIND